VTGGVLRGERSRFQLFGDTMNTASRMESTGRRNQIQVSQAAADHLLAAGKGHWLTAREEHVTAKGKGQLQTYFLSLTLATSAASDPTQEQATLGEVATPVLTQAEPSRDETTERLIQWHVDALLKYIPSIMARAERLSKGIPASDDVGTEPSKTALVALDEVKEIVHLSEFVYARQSKCMKYNANVGVPQNVQEQLRGYITAIASMYNGKQIQAGAYSLPSILTSLCVRLPRQPLS
jgi:Adenylate and Guanylate cyclase catalytic domain